MSKKEREDMCAWIHTYIEREGWEGEIQREGIEKKDGWTDGGGIERGKEGVR